MTDAHRLADARWLRRIARNRSVLGSCTGVFAMLAALSAVRTTESRLDIAAGLVAGLVAGAWTYQRYAHAAVELHGDRLVVRNPFRTVAVAAADVVAVRMRQVHYDSFSPRIVHRTPSGTRSVTLVAVPYAAVEDPVLAPYLERAATSH